MPSPFPGMDPYLEAPHLWEDLHHSLAYQISAQLTPLIRPRYVARVERSVSYDAPPPKPDLSPQDAAYVDTLLREENALNCE